MFKWLLWGALVLCYINTNCQDTFSIVAVDTITGEVGSAGASCVDLFNIPGTITNDFLGELFPNVGAINTQAWYIPQNQVNARNKMNEGYSPQEIIDWLIENDAGNQPDLRQYGIVAVNEGSAESAAFTGNQTDDYKGHITGSNYSIQGNILLDANVLTAMETNFLETEGSLACKLMAALQGANIIGADSRCATKGTSSLFAFLKVAQPSDEFGNPSLLISVRTADGDGIEPIDSLQIIFNQNLSCETIPLSTTNFNDKQELVFSPTISNNYLNVSHFNCPDCFFEVFNIQGEKLLQQKGLAQINISTLTNGMYFLRINDSLRHTSTTLKFIIN